MKGQSLLEIVIAIGIATMLVTVAAGLVTTSLGNANYVKAQTQASQYAQEGIEIIRQLRDTNYTTIADANLGDSSPTIYCMGSGRGLNSTCNANTANIGSIYQRKIIFQIDDLDCGTDVIRVTSEVSWSDSKCASSTFCHSAKLTSCFVNYNTIPAP